MSLKENPRYYFAFKTENNNWIICNRTFAISDCNIVSGQFLSSGWFKHLMSDLDKGYELIILKINNISKKTMLNKLNNKQICNNYNNIPEVLIHCRVNMNDINECKKHLLANLNKSDNNMTSIDYIPIVNNKAGFNLKNVKFVIECSYDKSPILYKNNIHYCLTLPSFKYYG